MSNPSPNKSSLLSQLLGMLQERLSDAQQTLLTTQASLGNETKSTAGDKYETGRAMVQIELQKLAMQRDKVDQQIQILTKIDPQKPCEKVEFGAFVQTNKERYFVAVGMGKVELQDGLVYVISLDSPIGRALQDRKAGERVHFQGRELHLVTID
ncbi:MAG: GreA/GreB family elongation factor [Bacteroidia bacterium]